MRDEASFTASLIAVCRGLGRMLPEDAQLARDPYGERFATPRLAFVVRHAKFFAPLLEQLLLTVQVRTRLIDDALTAFVRDGGSQILLLGAGFDARASRFADLLQHTRVFEVDHPATQAKKRTLLADPACVAYVPWDFEARSVLELPHALESLGHDRSIPTLTIWEGVTMYLSAEAIEASFAAVSVLSAPGSVFVVTYIDEHSLTKPNFAARLRQRFVASRGEAIKTGFVPDALAERLAPHGFFPAADASFSDAARALLPEPYHGGFVERANRVLIARRR